MAVNEPLQTPGQQVTDGPKFLMDLNDLAFNVPSLHVPDDVLQTLTGVVSY